MGRAFRGFAEYALVPNQSQKRSGHLWQNRFFSCPLDAAQLEKAMRLIQDILA
jgi:hypothetical protein